MNNNNKKRKSWSPLNWVNAFGIWLINVSAFIKKWHLLKPVERNISKYFQSKEIILKLTLHVFLNQPLREMGVNSELSQLTLVPEIKAKKCKISSKLSE